MLTKCTDTDPVSNQAGPNACHSSNYSGIEALRIWGVTQACSKRGVSWDQ